MSNRRLGSGRASKGVANLRRAAQTGRRAWPVVLMAWERWQTLPEPDKERYRRHARQAAAKGREYAVRRGKRRFRR